MLTWIKLQQSSNMHFTAHLCLPMLMVACLCITTGESGVNSLTLNCSKFCSGHPFSFPASAADSWFVAAAAIGEDEGCITGDARGWEFVHGLIEKRRMFTELWYAVVVLLWCVIITLYRHLVLFLVVSSVCVSVIIRLLYGMSDSCFVKTFFFASKNIFFSCEFLLPYWIFLRWWKRDIR